MIDAVALGEILIDFTPAGVSPRGAALYARNAGGAPANVLAMMSILGCTTEFIGRIGNDGFGTFLRQTLEQHSIGCRGLKTGSEPTTLAFVHLADTGERSFSFCRNNSADVMLSKDEVDLQLLQECRIFHFGSVSMTQEPCAAATLYAAQKAKELGKIVSYDPNYRPALWDNSAHAAEVMRQGLQYADIVKVSDNELPLLTDESDFTKGARWLVANGAKLALVTAGEQGTWYAAADCEGHIPSFTVPTVDTTGAGDTFLGALLYQLQRHDFPINGGREQTLVECIRFANAAGALCTTGYGAIASMPDEEKIINLLTKEDNK